MRVDLEEEEEIKQQRLEELVLSRSNSSFHLLQILLFRPSGKIEPADESTLIFRAIKKLWNEINPDCIIPEQTGIM